MMKRYDDEIVFPKQAKSTETPEMALATTTTTSQDHSSNFRRKCSSWCLLTCISLCLVWVILFTVLAAHTEFMRNHVYESFDTDRYYLAHKAGSRLFTYLVVFFIVPGVLTHAAKQQGISLPTPSRAMVRVSHNCWSCFRQGRQRRRRFATMLRLSRMELLVLFILVATQIATFITRVQQRFEISYWPPERVWYELSKTTGKLIAFNCLWLLLPVAKSCFWWSLFNYQFERVIKWHRWIAWWIVVLVLAHAFTAVVSLMKAGSLVDCWVLNENCHKPGGFEDYMGKETSHIVFYGWITFALGSVLVVTSLPYFRRRHFEGFYYTHVIVFVPLLLTMHFHYPDMIYYMAPGLSAYLLDKTVWLYTSRRSTRITALCQPAPGFVRIEIVVDTTLYEPFEPGQWVQLNIPAISFWEWHPMSIASGPTQGKSISTVTVDVKVLGDWTAKLSKLAETFEPSNVSQNTIFLDNFYGSSHSTLQGYLSHPVVVLIAGGIGVTPAMSALRDIVQHNQTKYPRIRKVVFAWCVKKISGTQLYRKELAYYQQELPTLESGCELEILVHATLSEKEDDTETNADCPDTTPGSPLNDMNRGKCGKRIKGQIERMAVVFISGGSVFLGIFLSRVASHDKQWSDVAVSALQLLFVLLLTSLSVTAFLALRPYYWSRTDDDCDAVYEMDKERSHLAYQNHIENDGEEGHVDLEMVIGTRPNPKQLFKKLKKYCHKNGFKSVGVSVCGPSILVSSVCDASKSCSETNVEFVVDEESFDW